MNILVTGGNGFLGKFAKLYFQDNAYYNFIWGTTSSSKEGSTLFSNLYENISEVLSKQEIDAIIHLASIIPQSFSSANLESTFIPNIRMMENLYQFSIKKKVSRFINISSFGSMNTPQTYDIGDHYTLSKIVGEHYMAMLSKQGISTVSLRLSSPYGPYSTAKSVLNIFTEKALKDEAIQVFGAGTREQNFIYAGDVLSAIETCLNSNELQGVHNLVAEKNTSMLELAHTIKEVTTSSSSIEVGQQDDPLEHIKPTNKPSAELEACGYEQSVSLEEGIKSYVDWYKSQ